MAKDQSLTPNADPGSPSRGVPRAPIAQLIEQMREQADHLDFSADPHEHMDVSMTFTYAAETLRKGADQLAALLAAEAAPAPDPGWRDIATLPDEIRRDQTHVLLWLVDDQGDGVEAVACWFSGWTNPLNSKRYTDEPTHWMPLPDPPAGSDPG